MATSIPTTLNDLLVKLKILSMLEVNKKINMNSLTFVDASSWIGTIQRSMSGEGRKNLMIHINQIIGQAISAIYEYYDTEFCRLIVNHLAAARIGIQTLITTYMSDPGIIAQVTVCIENINLQLEKHRDLLEQQYLNPYRSSTPISIEPTHSSTSPEKLSPNKHKRTSPK